MCYTQLCCMVVLLCVSPSCMLGVCLMEFYGAGTKPPSQCVGTRQAVPATPYSQGGRASAPQNLPHARAGQVRGALSTHWVCVGGQLTHLQLSLVDGCTAGLGLVFET